jgi:hypothetical protein
MLLTFYLQIERKKEPTSGLEPLTCSSYEFACTRASPYWCVRFSAFLGGFRWSGGLGVSIAYRRMPARLRYGCGKVFAL